MVLDGGGLFVVKYVGSGRFARVNVGSGKPWLITGGSQRSIVLGADSCPVTLVWRDFVVPIVPTQREVRLSSLVTQIGSIGAQRLFPNLVFEVAATLLGRGSWLVTAPEIDACALKAIGLGRRQESYKDYEAASREKAASGEPIHALVVDSSIGMNLRATDVNGTLWCGKLLEFVISGYWEGDEQSLCHVEGAPDAQSVDPIRCIGKRVRVRAQFDGFL